ncbi:MAG: TonB-dependent receptor [Gemmatimonadaceae bacterium]|nr:TonB-dependent receptor [Gemmatimonadaceae bacterium]
MTVPDHLPMPLPRPVVRVVLELVIALGLPLGAAAQQPARPDSSARDSTRAMSAVTVRAPYAPAVVGSAAVVAIRADSLPGLTAAPLLSDMLRRIPFLYVRQNARGENELSVRGSESRQAAVFFEGVPLTLTWDARADPTIIPMSGVQRVEFARGLSSILAGPNAIGGVISASLWDEPSTDRGAPRLTRLDVQTDQFGGTRMTGAAGGTVLANAAGTLAVRAGGGWRDSPGVARPASITEPGTTDDLRLNSDARTVDGFAGARYATTRGAYVSGVMSAMSADRGVVPELHIRAPRLWRNPSLTRQVLSLSAGTGEFRNRVGRGDVEATIGLNRGDVAIAAYADRTYQRVTDRERGEDRTITSRLIADHSLFAERAVVRASYTRADTRYDEVLGLVATPAVRYAQRLESYGAEVDVRPTPFVTVTGGLVSDHVRTPRAGGRVAQPNTDGIGWRTGATWFLPTAGLRLHVSASERKRFPALRELYSGALNRFAPNPSLRPETFRGAEAGATLARGRFDGQAVAFTSRTDDAVIRITLPDRRFQRVNRDRFSTSGVELLGGVSLGAVQLRGDFTIQDATITDKSVTANAEREPENLPLRFGSLNAISRLPWRAEGFARARYLGSTSCLNPDTNRRDRQGAAMAVDLGVERHWGLRGWAQRFRALVALDNVGDRALYDQCGLPQPGRTLRIGIGVG